MNLLEKEIEMYEYVLKSLISYGCTIEEASSSAEYAVKSFRVFFDAESTDYDYQDMQDEIETLVLKAKNSEYPAAHTAKEIMDLITGK